MTLWAPELYVRAMMMAAYGTDGHPLQYTALELRRAVPDVGVLLLSMDVETRHARELFAEWTSGSGRYRLPTLKERADGSAFVDNVRQIALGGIKFDQLVIDQLVRAKRAREPLDRLTKCELEALSLVAQALSNKAIADKVSINEWSEEKNIGNIFSKLDIPQSDAHHRRVQAVPRYLSST